MSFKALVFLASFLLFEIEPIVAKLLLPRFGSSASVWTTSLIFFQAALLAGYLVASRTTRSPSYRWGHLALMALGACALPIRLPDFALSPALAVLATLALGVGLPFVALSTTSIVAQRWLARSGLPEARDPYFLYGVSNAGALLALVTYPVLVEPFLDVNAQLIVWYVGYAAWLLLHVACLPRASALADIPHQDDAAPPTGAGPWLTWLLLAAAPTAFLYACTHAVTLDAPVPLLWMIPMSVYLGTLVVTFARRAPGTAAVERIALALLGLAGLGAWMVTRGVEPQAGFVLAHVVVLGIVALLCHHHLAAARPVHPGQLGSFYLALSVGGLVGTLFVAVLVPALGRFLVLPTVEYLMAGAFLAAALAARDRASIRAWLRVHPLAGATGGLAAACALAAVLWIYSPGRGGWLYASRTFYGAYSVSDDGQLRTFRHGNTIHGTESRAATEAGQPLGYYGRTSPIGQLLAPPGPSRTVGVVGLGVGSLAAYGRAGERWDFFEIDPEVEHVARTYFSFLRRSPADVHVILGDARVRLGAVPESRYDVLVIDAFASDFVPLHLLSREAIALYRSRLRPGGMVVLHASSRVLDLIPVITALAADQGLYCARQISAGSGPGSFTSEWVVLTADPALHATLLQKGWEPLVLTPELAERRVWSDNYVNLFHALRSGG